MIKQIYIKKINRILKLLSIRDITTVKAGIQDTYIDQFGIQDTTGICTHKRRERVIYLNIHFRVRDGQYFSCPAGVNF